MRRLYLALLVPLMLAGCTTAGTTSHLASPPPSTPTVSQPTIAQPVASANHTPDSLSQIEVRGLLADSQGVQYLVQDRAMQLYHVSPSGVTALGTSPDLQMVAAWGPNDGPFAYASKGTGGNYEIVGVGHEGSKVLAKAVGYPGAMRFDGQTLHFIDAEGWKVVDWSGKAELKGKLSLGLRSNQPAACAWLKDGPLCVGGYWDQTSAADDWLSLARPGAAPVHVAAKGEHPILGGAAFTADGRMLAAILGARSASATDLGRIVVAWIDAHGKPIKTRDYPILARQVAFDAYGRLVVHQFPADGAGLGTLVLLDPEAGTTQPLTAADGQFSMAADGKSLYLIAREGGVTRITLPPPGRAPSEPSNAGR